MRDAKVRTRTRAQSTVATLRTGAQQYAHLCARGACPCRTLTRKPPRSPPPPYYLELLQIYTIYEGTSEVQRLIISRELLTAPEQTAP